uniref:Uncharacterized protein n=1 Tax=Setaria viridis TaxID=4556 RepID=A0A4U6SXR2_SETVI|nr:hypothetical protein SEVIR_9G245800v2 [Setaria viridis]
MPVANWRGAGPPPPPTVPPPPSSSPPGVQRGPQRGPPPLAHQLTPQQGLPQPNRRSPPAVSDGLSGSIATGSAADCSTPFDSSPIRAGAPVDPAVATSHPPPLGAPCRRPRVELCVIPCTTEVVAIEITLERALVAMVARTWPEMTAADVEAYLEDFLVMFRDGDAIIDARY